MFAENLAALFWLYARPVAAISRILDRGRLWIALVIALAVSMLVHLPQMSPPSLDLVTVQMQPGPDAGQPDQIRQPRRPDTGATIAAAAIRWTGLDPFSVLS